MASLWATLNISKIYNIGDLRNIVNLFNYINILLNSNTYVHIVC